MEQYLGAFIYESVDYGITGSVLMITFDFDDGDDSTCEYQCIRGSL